MNLLDFKKITFALSVMKLIILFLSTPFFSAKKFFGLSNKKAFLKISLNKSTLTLSPLFLSFPLSFASENSEFPTKSILFILTFLFFMILMLSLTLLTTTESVSCSIFT